MKLSRSLKADLALIAITFIWGSTFTVVKASLEQISPVLFVALRFWLATVIVLVCMPGQLAKISGETLRKGLLLALFLLGGFLFQTLGLRSTGPSNSAFITSLSVLLVPLLGFAFFRHRPRMQTIAGIILAMSGLYFMLMNLTDLNLQSGDALTLICAILFAFQILFLSRFVAGADFRHLMILQVAGVALFSTAMMPFIETPFVVWSPQLVFYFFITAVLATALAFYVQARAQQHTTANRAALIFSLEPLFAALFAYWLLGDRLSVREWIGGALILAGILTSELRFSSQNGSEQDA